MEITQKEYFVNQHSIVREIWGKSDTILFIFAGSAAEFALNKAVDWLYYTGRLPEDPIGRLFSTVTYAQKIIFCEKESALRTIDNMTSIHANLEKQREMQIPDWAYRDVLFMLIDYSIRSFEIIERKLTLAEKEEVFDVFYRLGERMKLNGLPMSFGSWETMRREHLHQDLQYSQLTEHLFRQYRKHLGPVRNRILLEAQILVAPPRVKALLGFRKHSLLFPLVGIYKLTRVIRADWLLRDAILPSSYKAEISKMDRVPA